MWKTKTPTRWSINTLPGFKMFCKSCFAWAVFRKKEQKAQAREEYMVLRNDLLGAENGIMRWDVEEIVTVIAQREEYKDQAETIMEKPVGPQ